MQLHFFWWTTCLIFSYFDHNNWQWKVVLSPGPTQFSVASSMEKRERTWYLFSHEWRQDKKMVEDFNCVWAHWAHNKKKEPRYQVTYHMYLASGRWLSYTPCSQLKTHNVLQFRHFLILSCSREKNIPGFPWISAITKKLGGPGNEAKWKVCG